MMKATSFLAAALLTCLALPAAAETRVHLGPSWSGQSELSAAPAVFVQFPGKSTNTFLDKIEFQHFANLGVIEGRSREGDQQDVWLAGAGVRATRPGHGPRYWFLESQVFMNAGETTSLSGHFQFGNGIGYAHGPWEVMVKHISNARIRPPNHGETMVLVGYNF
ncbi:lipid A 3-O-deacylase PagL [Lysobacter ruishenii]|uniref:Lipid A 3-O-deacylase PagL n=2 Tax=Aerolutibacter ruishenii TaxID=686800 RepID=A0A562LVB0_9GAMM|nr:lipid A 3-O-deacylase PagL [Lysobacter ruishenii]